MRLFRMPQITPRVWEPPEGLCPQFCLRLMAHPSERIQHVIEKAVAMDTGNKEGRNGFGEVSTPLQSSTVRCCVNCFRLIQRIQQPKVGDERRWEKKVNGPEEGGGRCTDQSLCHPIFHSRQKHLPGYQFGALKQSSPPALPSIIFSSPSTPPPTRPHLRAGRRWSSRRGKHFWGTVRSHYAAVQDSALCRALIGILASTPSVIVGPSSITRGDQ